MVCLFSSVALSQNQGPDLRAQVANINYRGASNIDDYLSRCEQVRALLPQVDVFYKQGEATIARHRKQDSNRPDLIKLADFYAGMNAKDQASLALLRQEMELALRMAKL